jgi:hypothetical protein
MVISHASRAPRLWRSHAFGTLGRHTRFGVAVSRREEDRMGLFDMFGAGGGTASIRVDSPMVAQGGVVSGQIIFTGGSRAQQVTKVTLRVSQSHKTMKMTPNGPQQHTESRDVVPNFQVAGSYTTTPGQPQAFPFQINIPAGAPPSVPGQVTYSLHAGIDIPGEIDAGAHQEITVTGGAMGMAQPMMGQPMGMRQPMMGQPMGMQQPMMGQPMGMQQPMMGQPMMQQPLGIGSAVMAMWQDGQLHPGRIVGQQNGMFGIDWDEPHLGASTWVHPGQVQPSMGMPMGKPGMDPMMQKQMMDPMHKGGAPMGKPGMDPMHKGMDPMMQKGHVDPMMQKGHVDPMHKGGMPMQGGGVMMGAHVLAQHPSGQWAHGRVAAMQNGMIGVDWDDPKLGASSWVAPHQVQSK